MKNLKTSSKVVHLHGCKKENINYLAENSFAPLMGFFWLHGFSFSIKFKQTCKHIFLLVISILLFIIFEGNSFYAMASHFSIMHNGKTDLENCVLGFILVFEEMLRISLYMTGRKHTFLTNRLLKLYSRVTSKKLTKFKYASFFILLFNDILNVNVMVTIFSEHGFSDMFTYLGNNHKYGYIPAPYSTAVFYASVFIGDWCAMTYFIPIYFCSICFILKKILHELTNKVLRRNISCLATVQHVYYKVGELISAVNQTLHISLLITFVVLLGKVFFACYKVIFKNENRIMYRITPILSFARFVFMCLFASSVSNAASNFKDALYNVSFRKNVKWNNMEFFNKVNTDFIGFKLLDSLIIDKNLIMSSLGSLLTYGILIATFDINSKNN